MTVILDSTFQVLQKVVAWANQEIRLPEKMYFLEKVDTSSAHPSFVYASLGEWHVRIGWHDHENRVHLHWDVGFGKAIRWSKESAIHWLERNIETFRELAEASEFMTIDEAKAEGLIEKKE